MSHKTKLIIGAFVAVVLILKFRNSLIPLFSKLGPVGSFIG